MASSVVRSGRTTPRKSATTRSKGHIDIDAVLAEQGLTPRLADEIEVTTIDVLGEKDVRVLKTTNIFNISMFASDDPDDTANSMRTIIDMVHPDDQRRFRHALARVPDLSGEAFVVIVGQMLQAATGANPTNSRSGSGRTARASISAAQSAEN
jgi:hypothetical protein